RVSQDPDRPRHVLDGREGTWKFAPNFQDVSRSAWKFPAPRHVELGQGVLDDGLDDPPQRPPDLRDKRIPDELLTLPRHQLLSDVTHRSLLLAHAGSISSSSLPHPFARSAARDDSSDVR